MKKRLTSLLLAICLSRCVAIAQKNEGKESISENSKFQTEADILFKQQMVDSLVKIRLLSYLQNESGSNKKTKELEKKLKKIEVDDSLRKLELITKIESIRKTSKGSAVVPFNDTLFLIYFKIGSYSPADRALGITRHIIKIYNDPYFKPDSIYLMQTENGTEIIYNSDYVVMLVTKMDAMYYNKDDYQLASEYLDIIKKSIVAQRQSKSITNLILPVGKVALIIACLGLLIFLNNRLFSITNNYIKSNRIKFKDGFVINKIRLLSPEHLESSILRITRLLQILAILLVVYFSLPLIFSIFPETKMWTTTLLNWIVTPTRKALNGIIAFLPNLFSILVIFFIFRYTIRGIRFFVMQIEKGEIQINGFYADWAMPTFRILKFLLYAFMLVLIFPYLPGSGSPVFQGVSVFIGVLFSLGSSSAIANAVAGMVITYMRPFRIGDRVRIGEITGDVIAKTTLVTRLRTIKNEDVTVPNSTILLGSTTNYSTNTLSHETGLIIHTKVTIGYDTPWKEVHQALINAALRTELILKQPQPFVLQTSLDDFYVVYQVNGYTKEANNQAQIYSQLHQNIQDCCNEASIEIMSPHFRAQRDGNKTTIPDNYLGNSYKAPSFNIKQVNNG